MCQNDSKTDYKSLNVLIYTLLSFIYIYTGNKTNALIPLNTAHRKGK